MRLLTFPGWGVGRKWNCNVLCVRLMVGIREKITHRKCPFPEHYHVHVDGIQVSWAVWILVETPETDEIVVAK